MVIRASFWTYINSCCILSFLIIDMMPCNILETGNAVLFIIGIEICRNKNYNMVRICKGRYNIMIGFIFWFFQTPTAFVAVLSLIVAFFTYKYQRNWNRKQHTKEVLEWYAQNALPKFRYINSILTSIGCMDILNKFSKFEDFDSKELNDNLSIATTGLEEFKEKFKSITEDSLTNAFQVSGCNTYIYHCHNALKEALLLNNENHLYVALNKFIVDFLNEIEVMALQMNYYIYDEKMIYPILHQTFLKHIKYLYFFIAIENTQDYDQFYIYTIWLYILWDKRVKKEKQKLKNKFAKKSKTSKL